MMDDLLKRVDLTSKTTAYKIERELLANNFRFVAKHDGYLWYRTLQGNLACLIIVLRRGCWMAKELYVV